MSDSEGQMNANLVGGAESQESTTSARSSASLSSRTDSDNRVVDGLGPLIRVDVLDLAWLSSMDDGCFYDN